MNSKGISRHKSNLRLRQLGSRERVAQFSRNQVWERVTRFIRANWILLLLVIILPSLVYSPFYFLIHGSSRWIIVGAAGISGPWTVVLMTILLSGVADPLMGLDAENSTADEIRRLRRKGWKFANGIKIKGNEDIDHLVVGPAGVLVVESKWSRHRWPIGARSLPFMSDQLTNAIEQVLRNRRNVTIQFAGVLENVPVQAVCVVWSSEDSSMDPPWIEIQGAVIVRGPTFRNWLQSQKSEVLDETAVDRVWGRIEHQGSIRDDDDLKKSGIPRPTAGRILAEYFLAPFLGATFVVYGMAAISLVHQGWLDVASAWVFITIGLLTMKLAVAKAVLLRRLATGCIAISSIYFLLYLVTVIRVLVK